MISLSNIWSESNLITLNFLRQTVCYTIRDFKQKLHD